VLGARYDFRGVARIWPAIVQMLVACT
jgi:hypothetical protein